MRHFPRAAKALALVALALAAATLPEDASADAPAWVTPKQAEEAMARDRVPAMFVFEVPGDPASIALNRVLSEPQVVLVLNKHKYACVRIALHDMNSSRPWGNFQRFADEFEVSLTTTVVLVSYDRDVLSIVSQVSRRDDFLVTLGKTAGQHRDRVKLADDATEDLNTAETWIGEKKYADASRRLKMVLDKEAKLPKKIAERAKGLDSKLEAAGNERLAEGKKLLEAGRVDEAKAVLDEVAAAFSRYGCAKEAKELLKKAKKG